MTESGWKEDDAARARARAELDLIDKKQAHLPTCWLCGQRMRKLDAFGLCSKISDSHRHVREREAAK